MDSKSNGTKSPLTAKSKSKKRPYVKPQVRKIPLSCAKAQLEAKAVPGDPGAEEMLRRITRSLSGDEKLKIGLIPPDF
jgi:hypothetical protein